MGQVVLAFLAGALFGVIFSFLKLPIPAPPTLAGVMGVAGVYAGYLLVNHFIH